MPVDVQAILGGGDTTPPPTPLDTLTKWQALSTSQTQQQSAQQQIENAKQQLENAKLENQKGQVDLANKQAGGVYQNLLSILKENDDQVYPTAKQTIDEMLANRQIDAQRHAVFSQWLEANKDNPQAIRQKVVGGIGNFLTGRESLEAQARPVTDTNIPGLGQVGRVGPSVVERLPGQPTPSIVTSPSGVQPTYLTPSEAAEPETHPVLGKDGVYRDVTQPRGVWHPELMAPGRSAGGGVGAGTGGSGTGTGVGTGGGVSTGGGGPAPISSIPVGTGKEIEKDVETYKQDQELGPRLQTGVQSLHKALEALNAVATGQGTEGLARMRSLVTSIANVLGKPVGFTGQQDKDRTIAEKYLTDYARSQVAASGHGSDAELSAQFASNASVSKNNAAAQDVVRTNMGRDLQKVAAFMASKQAQGYGKHKNDFFNDTDPRGFAWNAYSDKQKAAIFKEVGEQGTPARDRLDRAIGWSKKLNLPDLTVRTPNVNVNQ